MQVTETERQDSEEVYQMIGEAVLMLADNGLETTRMRIAGFFREELARTDEWSLGIRLAMQNVIDMLEILPAWEKVEFHRNADGRVL